MSALGTYRRTFILSLNNQLVYRVNFIVGRLRQFIVYAAMLLIFSALPQGSGNYTREALLTYTLFSGLFASLLFVYAMEPIANEIITGDLTNYLLRPVNYFGYWISQLSAERCIVFMGGIVQLLVLRGLFSHVAFTFQTNIIPLFETVLLLVGSLVLLHLFDFTAGLISFWTHRGHGARWLLLILMQFLSGNYLPLDILPKGIQTLLNLTPFPMVLFVPLQAYLGRLSIGAWIQAVAVQWFWIGIALLGLRSTWRRGLRTYGAYGR